MGGYNRIWELEVAIGIGGGIGNLIWNRKVGIEIRTGCGIGNGGGIELEVESE